MRLSFYLPSNNKWVESPSITQHFPMFMIIRILYLLGMGIFGHVVDIGYPLLTVIDILNEDFIPINEVIVED